MAPQLLSAPNSVSLLNLLQVKTELGISGSTYDVLLQHLIDQADFLVADVLGYSPFRATRREYVRGSNRLALNLRGRPVLRIDAVSFKDFAVNVSDIQIASAEGGIISSDLGFASRGDPAEWQFDYLSGWNLVGDDSFGSVSVMSSDNSYNGAFTPYLIAGDRLAASGFTDPANNGNKYIVSATPTKLVVTEPLVDELAGSRTLGFKTVPAVIERAAMESVRTWYRAKSSSASVKSQTIDDVSITYTDAGSVSFQAGSIERDVAQMLLNWVG